MIGADRLVDGERAVRRRSRATTQHGDTYGPVVYVAYVPFEQALPWSGRWDDLPAAHAAAIVFDLLRVPLLFLIGRRVRGPDLGVVLAYAWATFPFTLYALEHERQRRARRRARAGGACWAAAQPARARGAASRSPG